MLTPVSYTHLDVYKRQGLDMKQNIANVLHDVTVKSIFNDDFKKYHNEGRAVQALGLRPDPMREDVYKRQLVNIALNSGLSGHQSS